MKLLFFIVLFVIFSVACSSQPSDDSASNPIPEPVTTQARSKFPKDTWIYGYMLKSFKHPLSEIDPSIFLKPEEVADNPAARKSFLIDLYTMKYQPALMANLVERTIFDKTNQILREFVEIHYNDLIANREAFINANLVDRVIEAELPFAAEIHKFKIMEEHQKKEQSKTRQRL